MLAVPINGKLELIKPTKKARPPEVYSDVSVVSIKFAKTSAALPCGARYTRGMSTAKNPRVCTIKMNLCSVSYGLADSSISYPSIFGNNFAPMVFTIITTTRAAHIKRVPCHLGAS